MGVEYHLSGFACVGQINIMRLWQSRTWATSTVTVTPLSNRTSWPPANW